MPRSSLRLRTVWMAGFIAFVVSCAPPPAATGAKSQGVAPQRAPSITRSLAPENSYTGDAPARPQPQAEVTPDTVPTKKTVKVGLLLPLTGRNAELGRAMQDTATVSLFDKYARLAANQQEIKVELLPKDTGDSQEQARKAMTEALAEGAQFIIGPVFSETTEAVAPIAAAKNISILSFSNNRARRAPGVYLMGFSPQEQARRVVEYALTKEKKQIAVLVPKTALGEEVMTAAREAAKRAGIALAVEVQYAPQGVGLDEALKKLLPGNGEGAAFDALLLAESGPMLETVLRALSARGVTPATTQFLGTGVWDDLALLRSVNLDGAWFASSAPHMTAQFESRFRATYNYTPPRIASLAYDAVALAVTLAVSDRPLNAEAITVEGGFVGPANGIFRLRKDGAAERGLAVIQVDGANLKVISPAPTGFISN